MKVGCKGVYIIRTCLHDDFDCCFLLILVENIHCGSTLEQERVPTIYVLEQYEKIIFIPVNPSLTIIIKVGCKGSK